MSGSWFFEENFNGLSDDFFDDVISNLDFPLEDVEPSNGGEDWNIGLQNLEAPPMDDMLLGSCKGDVGVQTSLQHSQLSPSEASSSSKSSINSTVSRFFQSTSPVSVLGSNSVFSPDKKPISLAPTFIATVKGRRSKRKRSSTPKAFLFAPLEKLQPSISSASETNSIPGEKPIKRKWKKQKSLGFAQEGSLRKCTHCETTKTPQWREGPKGPKTLCNACGVRYRSGRLVPEYRPASSPTFTPSVHSNSHRKIVEMRKTTMINA